VGPDLVVKGDPSADTCSGFRFGFIGVQVHVLVFERAPEAFNEHIVQPAATAVHGDADSIIPQDAREGKAGKLAALIGVEDIRRAMFRQGLFQGGKAKIRLHGVGQPPRQHFPAMPVHDGDQIQKALAHGDVRDIRTPDLVAPVYAQAAEQVGIAFVLRVWGAGLRLLVHRHEPHQSHQATNAFYAGAVPQRHKVTAHLAHAKKRPLCKSQVDFPHQHEVYARFSRSFIIQTGTGYLEQGALPHNAEPLMAGINHALPAGDAHRFPQALAKKSRSTVSWTILA
jgi:Protein of unknown function (DUF2699).